MLLKKLQGASVLAKQALFFRADEPALIEGKFSIVLASLDRKTFRIVIHSKQTVLAELTVISPKSVQVKDSLRIDITDHTACQWIVQFKAENDLFDFLKWLCVALSSTRERNVIYYDIAQGIGEPVGLGDLVEIEYTEYLIENGPRVTEFNGNLHSDRLLKVRIGKDKVPKGWEEGLLTVRKNGRRIFLIPPDVGCSLHDSSSSKVPIIVYVHIKNVQTAFDPCIRRTASTSSSRIVNGRHSRRKVFSRKKSRSFGSDTDVKEEKTSSTLCSRNGGESLALDEIDRVSTIDRSTNLTGSLDDIHLRESFDEIEPNSCRRNSAELAIFCVELTRNRDLDCVQFKFPYSLTEYRALTSSYCHLCAHSASSSAVATGHNSPLFPLPPAPSLTQNVQVFDVSSQDNGLSSTASGGQLSVNLDDLYCRMSELNETVETKMDQICNTMQSFFGLQSQRHGIMTADRRFANVLNQKLAELQNQAYITTHYSHFHVDGFPVNYSCLLEIGNA
ncbi:unnamed protein product [Soboliphyme baturini]|uniref:peptidylprolyl isomerase n=1 Tax=Soboliphyme baturini TaxID=241478 RepID=A0A183IMY1_9BILA|nr:unnamed protein product [Soboliphyme baturini]